MQGYLFLNAQTGGKSFENTYCILGKTFQLIDTKTNRIIVISQNFLPLKRQVDKQMCEFCL